MRQSRSTSTQPTLSKWGSWLISGLRSSSSGSVPSIPPNVQISRWNFETPWRPMGFRGGWLENAPSIRTHRCGPSESRYAERKRLSVIAETRMMGDAPLLSSSGEAGPGGTGARTLVPGSPHMMKSWTRTLFPPSSPAIRSSLRTLGRRDGANRHWPACPATHSLKPRRLEDEAV